MHAIVRFGIALVAVTACTARPPAPAAPAASAATQGPPIPAPPGPNASSEAEIKQLSHDLLEAHDRGDEAAVGALLAPDFLHYEGGPGRDRNDVLAGLRRHNARSGSAVASTRWSRGGTNAGYITSRTWQDERVRIHGNSATFTGKAIERQGGNDAKGGYKDVGWYLLDWVRRGNVWQVRLWTWLRAGEQEMRNHWNGVFRDGLGFAHEPNRLLVETVRGKKPGTALDVAMGQGRNALHLAAQGWKVTGIDISDEGIRIAREQAAQRKLAIETVNTDIDEYDFGKDRWDLVTMIYAGSKVAWIEKIKPSLRPGGLFIVEYFARGPDSESGFPPGQLAKLFATGFEILRDEVVEDAPDWALDRARLVRFVAKKR